MGLGGGVQWSTRQGGRPGYCTCEPRKCSNPAAGSLNANLASALAAVPVLGEPLSLLFSVAVPSRLSRTALQPAGGAGAS